MNLVSFRLEEKKDIVCFILSSRIVMFKNIFLSVRGIEGLGGREIGR